MERFKQYVRQSHPPLSSKLDPGQLLGRTGEILRIGFPRNYIFLEDLERQHKQTLSEMARDFFQNPALEVCIEAVREEAEGNSGKAVNGSAKTQRRGEIKQEALKHPLLQKIMDVFENAEIREIIPRRPLGGDETGNPPNDL